MRLIGLTTMLLIQGVVSPHAEPLQVAVGGTSGLLALTDPKATERFREQAGTGFYIHYTATDPVKFGSGLTKIAAQFRGRRSIAEVSLGGGFNPGFWKTAWRTNVLAYGFAPDSVVVNVEINAVDAVEAVSSKTINEFQAFIEAGRADTAVKTYAPVVSPNQSGGPGKLGDEKTIAIAHSWDSAWWDGARRLAIAGGGIALDAPPAFFFRGLPTPEQQGAYQRFEEDILRWAHRKGLWTVAIVSPYFDGVSFGRDAQAFYAALKDAGAPPDTWVVENYNECGAPFPKACGPGDAAFLAPVGLETTPNTVAAVALWFTFKLHNKTN